MTLRRIFAHLSCRDLEASSDWSCKVFGRAPDAAPMDGLREWHQGDGGFQLFQDGDSAGYGTMTLIVDDLASELDRLRSSGVEIAETSTGDVAMICQLRDPDSNLIVLAEPT